MVHHFRQRVAPPEILIGQIASGYPAFQDVRSLSFHPLNVEIISGGPMHISLQLNVAHLSNIDQKSQTFDMQYELTWTWRDCRLLSNCSMIMFDNTNIDFPKFWRPNYKIEERVDDKKDLAALRFFFSGDGIATLSEDRRSTFRCIFFFAEMPFDSQTCKLTFRLPGTLASKIALNLFSINTTELTDVEWRIAKEENWRHSQLERLYPTPLDHLESVIEIEFGLHRRPTYQLKTYVLPSTLFYLISYVGLWVDHRAVPARAAIGVVPPLIMSNTMIASAAAIPPISYKTRLQSMMLCTLCFISLHMLTFGSVHFATRFGKVWVAAKGYIHSEEDPEPVDKAPAKSIAVWAIAKVVGFLCNHMECFLRLASPVAFILSVVIIMVV